MSTASTTFDVSALDTPSAFLSPYQQQQALSIDNAPSWAIDPGYIPVVPTSDQLSSAMAAASGSQFVPAPTSYGSDSSGVSSVPIRSANTPNPTGDWESVATALISSAAKGFTAYSSGSPSAAIPKARTATGQVNTGLLTTATGGTNWALIGVVLLVAVGGIWAVVHYA